MFSAIFKVLDVEGNTLFFIVKSAKGGALHITTQKGDANWFAIHEDKEFGWYLLLDKVIFDLINYIYNLNSIECNQIIARIHSEQSLVAELPVMYLDLIPRKPYFFVLDSEREFIVYPESDKDYVITQANNLPIDIRNTKTV